MEKLYICPMFKDCPAKAVDFYKHCKPHAKSGGCTCSKCGSRAPGKCIVVKRHKIKNLGFSIEV